VHGARAVCEARAGAWLAVLSCNPLTPVLCVVRVLSVNSPGCDEPRDAARDPSAHPGRTGSTYAGVCQC
jgi:hypothetical protein